MHNIQKHHVIFGSQRSAEMVYSILKWDHESDGDASHVPTIPNMVPADQEADRIFRHKLGQRLMQELGNAVIGRCHPRNCYGP